MTSESRRRDVARPRGKCRHCGGEKWDGDDHLGWFCGGCLMFAPERANQKQKDDAALDVYVEPAARLLGEVYAKCRAQGANREAALRLALDDVLARVPELDESTYLLVADVERFRQYDFK